MSGFLYGIDPDVPVFRIARAGLFVEELAGGRTRLVRPGSWEDPQEDVITRMAFQYDSDPGVQVFGDERTLPPVFAQCWSHTEDSDMLWRAYSRVRHDESGRKKHADEEGLQLRSTPRHLLSALMAGAPLEGRSFVGAVRYVPREGVSQEVVNEVGSSGLDSFLDPVKRAFVALYKRDSFAHEAEVRMIYVGNVGDNDPRIEIPFDANEAVQQVTLDGRLNETERREREVQLRDAGFRGPVIRSDLYQGMYWQVPLTGPRPTA